MAEPTPDRIGTLIGYVATKSGKGSRVVQGSIGANITKIECWAQKPDDTDDIDLQHKYQLHEGAESVEFFWDNRSHRTIPFDYRITVLADR